MLKEKNYQLHFSNEIMVLKNENPIITLAFGIFYLYKRF